MIYKFIEKGFVPDFLIRYGIKHLLQRRLNQEYSGDTEALQKKRVRELSEGVIAVNTVDANEQHYEVPTDFYHSVLGHWKKYSSGFWENGACNIDESETHMLDLYVERAKLEDGMRILDLGCGWGSMTLYLAQRFPQCRITSVSNSRSQKIWIDEACEERGHTNVEVLTCDINELDFPEDEFDRVVSIEMFEHVRNYKALLEKICGWMKAEGKLFIHIFTHKELTYYFDVVDESDWMSKYFFSGGIMPSHSLIEEIESPLAIAGKWKVSGLNYWRTSEAWLQNQDKNRSKVLNVFKQSYPGETRKWFEYWRVFFLACAELFRYNDGQEWFVSHYLLEKKSL
tara:strand:- start:735 stop:1757 length:1023 start_codon:yes stop_codon:yes gene_type:complete